MSITPQIRRVFEEKFNIEWENLTALEDICSTSYDDGQIHFLDSSANIYTYDTGDDVWLEKNECINSVLDLLRDEPQLHAQLIRDIRSHL